MISNNLEDNKNLYKSNEWYGTPQHTDNILSMILAGVVTVTGIVLLYLIVSSLK
jgi:hypothetical protein